MTQEPRITIEQKPWWKSWTIYLNGLALLSVLVDWAITQELSFVSEEWFVGVVSLLNVILRFVKTDRPIGAAQKLISVDRYIKAPDTGL